MRDELPVAVGRRIRELRTARGLSQEALAEKAELHRNYVGRVERGEKGVSLDVVYRLSSALGLSLTEFFDRLPKRPYRRG